MLRPGNEPLPESLVSIRGTLIIATLCRKGVLVGVDCGLAATDESGVIKSLARDETKVFRLTPSVVFTACGSIRFGDANSGLDIFDFIAFIRNYFGRYPFENSPEFWSNLEARLKAAFGRSLVANKPIEDWPQEEPDEDKILARLIFFWRHPDRRIFLTQLSFKYIRKIPVEISVLREQFWFSGLIYAAGHTTLLHQLSIKDDALYDLTSHPLVKLFLGGTTDPSKIRVDHALDFIRTIMKASEERLKDSWVVSEFKTELLEGYIRFSPLEQRPMSERKKTVKAKKKKRKRRR